MRTRCKARDYKKENNETLKMSKHEVLAAGGGEIHAAGGGTPPNIIYNDTLQALPQKMSEQTHFPPNPLSDIPIQDPK